MSEWRTDPAAVMAVIANTDVPYQALRASMPEHSIGEACDGLSWGGEATASVASALAEVLGAQRSVVLDCIAARIGTCMTGVSAASMQLHVGNEEMAQSTLAAMIDAESSSNADAPASMPYV